MVKKGHVDEKLFFFVIMFVGLFSALSFKILLIADKKGHLNDASVLATTDFGSGEGQGQESPTTAPTSSKQLPIPTDSQSNPFPTASTMPLPTTGYYPTPTTEIPNLVIINPSLTPPSTINPIEIGTIGGGTVNINDPNNTIQVKVKDGSLSVSITDPIVPPPIITSPPTIPAPVYPTITPGSFNIGDFVANIFNPQPTPTTLPGFTTIGSSQSSGIASGINGLLAQLFGQGFDRGAVDKANIISGNQPGDISSGFKIINDASGEFVTILPNFPFQTNIELDFSALDSINRYLDPYEIKIYAGRNSQLFLTRLGVTAATELPVRLSFARRSLSILTPQGEQKLVYLPDDITKYLSDLDIITRIDGHVVSRLFPQAQAAELTYPVYIGWKNNRLVYRVEGNRDEYLFAFLPVSIGIVAEVDARTKEIVNISYDSRIERILDVISI